MKKVPNFAKYISLPRPIHIIVFIQIISMSMFWEFHKSHTMVNRWEQNEPPKPAPEAHQTAIDGQTGKPG